MKKFAISILAVVGVVLAGNAISATVVPVTWASGDAGASAPLLLDAGGLGTDKVSVQSYSQAYSCVISTPGGVMNGQFDTGNILVQVSNDGTHWFPEVYSGTNTQVDAGFTASDAGPYVFGLVVPTAPYAYQRILFTGTLTAGGVQCQLSNN